MRGRESHQGYTCSLVPYSVIFQSEDAYARMRVFGKPSLEERDRAIDELIASPGFGALTPILIDGRQVEVLPDEAGLRAFAQHHAKRLSGHRVAYLMNRGIGYGVARQISTHMELKDIEVCAFADEGEAVAWLMESR